VDPAGERVVAGLAVSKRSSASSVKPARSATFQLRSLLSSMRTSTRRAPSVSKARRVIT